MIQVARPFLSFTLRLDTSRTIHVGSSQNCRDEKQVERRASLRPGASPRACEVECPLYDFGTKKAYPMGSIFASAVAVEAFVNEADRLPAGFIALSQGLYYNARHQ